MAVRSIIGARKSLLALATAAALATAVPVLAADQIAASGTGALEEIVVTARYKTESLQDTPLAITAVSGDLLEQRGMTSLDRVAALAPNVVLQQQGTNSGKSLTAFIRGIGQSDFNFALEPGVGIYMDDVYLGTLYGSILGLADVNRVEVLRGPQGTLFGKNSEGGAVRLYTTQPKGDGSGYAEVGYGSYSRLQIRGAFDVGLVPGKVALRVTGGSNTEKGYVDILDFACVNPAQAGTLPQSTVSPDCKVGTMGGTDIKYGRAQLRITPSDALAINLSVSHTRDTGESTPETLIAYPGGVTGVPDVGYNDSYALPTYGVAMDGRFVAPGFYQTYTNFRDLQSGLSMPNAAPLDEDFSVGTIDYKWSSGLSIKSVTSYRQYEGSFSLDQGGSPLFFLGIYNPVKHHAFTQEIRLSDTVKFGTEGSVDWTAGVHYYKGKSWSGGFVDLPSLNAAILGLPPVLTDAGITELRFTQNNTADAETKSAFFHANVDVTKAFGLELGYRYTDDSKAWSQNQYFIDNTGTPTGFAQLVTPSIPGPNKRSDYKVGASFKFTPNVMAYANVSTGFKSGGVNPRPLTPALAGKVFGPETVTAYELGAKFESADHRVRINGAAFRSDYKDLQAVGCFQIAGAPSGTCETRYGNYGKVRIQGYEAEIALAPVDNLQFDANYGYTDYKVVDTGALQSGGASIASKSPYVPRSKYQVGAQYGFSLGEHGRLTPRIEYLYQDSVVTDALDPATNPLSTEPSRSLVNAYVTYASQDSGWSASLEMTNLSDKKYYISRINSIAPFGNIDGQPGRPREVFFSLRKSFH